MPVRIYDISKKLGLENKEILAKAKALGIAAARVPSSSLDKITAEYLEEQILKDHPELAAPKPAARSRLSQLPAESPSFSSPRHRHRRSRRPRRRRSCRDTDLGRPLPEVAPPASRKPGTPNQPCRSSLPLPPEPPKPRVGEKVGFIQLAPKPQPRTPERTGNRPPGRDRSDALISCAGATPGISVAAPAGQQRSTGQRPAEPAKPAAPRSSPCRPTREVITIKPPIVVRELAEQLKQKPFKIIADLMEAGRLRQCEPGD